MPCTAVQNLIAQYVEGSLTDEEKAVVLEHLKECSQCRADLADSEFLAPLLKAHLSAPDPPDDFSRDVLKAVGKK